MLIHAGHIAYRIHGPPNVGRLQALLGLMAAQGHNVRSVDVYESGFAVHWRCPSCGEPKVSASFWEQAQEQAALLARTGAVRMTYPLGDQAGVAN